MTAIVEKATGRLIKTIIAPDDVVEMNTPEGCFAVEDPPESNMYYRGGWVAMPAQPSPYHIFNYDLKDWVDPRTIDEIKVQKWAEIKLQRDQLEFDGFEFEGNVYDSDQVSQGRILGAVNLGIDQVWTLADNSTVYLSSDDLVDLYAALQEHISNLHERSRVAREKIENAQTIEEVESVTL